MSRKMMLVGVCVIAVGAMSNEAVASGPTCESIGPCVETCPSNPTPESAAAWCASTFGACGVPTRAYWLCVVGCGPSNWEQVICDWSSEN